MSRPPLRAMAAVVLSLALLLLAWAIASARVGSALVLPRATDVAAQLRALCATPAFWGAAGATFVRCLWAMCIAVAAGTVVGSVCAFSECARSFFKVPLWLVKGTPVVALVLLALYWMGTTSIPVFAASLIALPVVSRAVQEGLRQADAGLLQMARSYRLTTGQQVRHIRLPAAAPFFAQGLSSAYGLVWKAVAAGEVLSLPKQALGTTLYQSQVHLETARTFAVTLALVFLGAASEWLFATMARLFMRIARRIQRKERHAAMPESAPATAAQEPPTLTHRLTASYGAMTVLDEFAFCATPGSVTALIAPSASGKTTLLTALAHRAAQDGHRVSFAFQDPRLIPTLSVRDNICLALKNCMTREQADVRTQRILQTCSLLGCADKLPHQLSGGQRQRASLARAFAYPSGVLLLDEAFQSQDVATEHGLLRLLTGLLHDEPRTVVLATHDIREACAIADTILVLKGPPLATCLTVTRQDRRNSAEQEYISPDAETIALEARIRNALLGIG